MMVSLESGRLYALQIVLALLSPALLVAGAYQIVTGRSAIRRRDGPPTEQVPAEPEREERL